MVFPSLISSEDKPEKNGCALKCQPLFHWKKTGWCTVRQSLYTNDVSCENSVPTCKSTSVPWDYKSSNFSISALVCDISLKEEMIARQKARPPHTARYPCMSSYTCWRWELGILHPRNPCLLHTEASLCSALALVQPSLQKTPCSWQNSWQTGRYPTSPLLRLGEGRKSKAVSHILSYYSNISSCYGVSVSPVHAVTTTGSH